MASSSASSDATFSRTSTIETQEWQSTVEKEKWVERGNATMKETETGYPLGLVGLYFMLNLALTFYNKSLLNGFPYPYLMTAVHAASGMLGCTVLRSCGVSFGVRAVDENLERGEAQMKELVPVSNSTRRTVITLYSTLYAANIAISNASLRLVSVPFHQIIRSTCPVFTLALGLALLSRQPHPMAIAALLPIVGGAILSCVGELSFTSYGFMLTVLGTVLAAVKTVTTNVLQGGGVAPRFQQHHGRRPLVQLVRAHIGNSFRYTPLQLLQVMSPLACAQCLLASYCTGELGRASRHFLVDGGTNYILLLLLMGNGTLAFALNVVSFKTNKAAGPLTMTVVGNAKQVSTILLAIWLFHVRMGTVNIAGVAIALLGTAWYGMVELRGKTG